MTLGCPRSVRDDLVDHARASDPLEACGVLGGSFDPAESRVASYRPLENVAGDPRRRYEVDPEAALACFESLEADDEELVGFAHSHPEGPSEPSETDRDLAAWPDRSYVIVSLAGRDPAVGSWRWREGRGRFEREAFVLE